MSKKEKIIVVGGGLVGSLLSLILGQKGYSVDVYEMRPDMRKENISAGRSINLALSHRGWNALEKAGAAPSLRKISLPMRGRMIHSLEGNLNFQPYGKENQAIYSVSRKDLNMELISLAEQKGKGNFHFSHKCVDLDLKDFKVHCKDLKNNKNARIKGDFIFATDGAFSPCRMALQKTDRFNFSQEYLDHGYKELCIPPVKKGKWALDKESLHIWPRHKFMLIALPNIDGSFTCTLFLPWEGEVAFENLKTREEVHAFFHQYFPDAMALMPTLLEDFFSNPTSSLATFRCYPWVYGNRMTLLGDSAHGIVPFYGQGMNAGFEDCSVLEELMENHGGNWGEILLALQKSRKPNTDAIADLAIENFREMRDRVGNAKFLLEKKVESKIQELYPDRFIPLYTMVTFTSIPYSEARRRGEKQAKFLELIMSIRGIEEKWEKGQVDGIIHEIMKDWEG